MATVTSFPLTTTPLTGVPRYDVEQDIPPEQQRQVRENIGVTLPKVRITEAGIFDVPNAQRGYQVEASVAGDVTFQLGPSAERNDLPFTVALVGADPVANTIRVDLADGETCRGEDHIDFESPYQVMTFYPLAAGGGYYIG